MLGALEMVRAKEVVIYASGDCRKAIQQVHNILARYHVPFREVRIDLDPAALGRVLLWTGRRSVPTLVVAQPGQDDPYLPPQPVKSWISPRGVDRGSIISEPSSVQLLSWLERQGFVRQQAA